MKTRSSRSKALWTAGSLLVLSVSANGRGETSQYSRGAIILRNLDPVEFSRGVIRSTRRTFDVRFAAQAQGVFLGDYAGLAGSDKHFYQLWVRTRRRSSDIGGKQSNLWTSRTR